MPLRRFASGVLPGSDTYIRLVELDESLSYPFLIDISALRVPQFAMKLALVSLLSLACVASASHQGGRTMEHLMSLKMQSRERARAQGLFNLNRYPDEADKKCSQGKAGEYSCENVDLLGFLSHQALGSVTREGNDLWGKGAESVAEVS